MEDIKIVLCDVDGTLLNSKNQVTPKTKEAIKKLKDYGILFGIATGRPVVSIEGLLPDWGIEEDVDIILGFNGGLVKDLSLNKEFQSDLLSGQYICEILKEYAPLDLGFGIFVDKKIYANKLSNQIYAISERNKFQLIICDLAKEFKDKEVFKMLAINEKDKTQEVIDYYNKIHVSPYYKGIKTSPFLFEFMDPNISKCHGIEKLALAHGCTMENICVFGDEMNDYEMIRDCYGIAMGNGNEKVKEIAKFVTLSNDEDGIAYYLNNYIFKEDNK